MNRCRSKYFQNLIVTTTIMTIVLLQLLGKEYGFQLTMFFIVFPSSPFARIKISNYLTWMHCFWEISGLNKSNNVLEGSACLLVTKKHWIQRLFQDRTKHLYGALLRKYLKT